MNRIAMISQPMAGKSKVEIEATRNRAIRALEEKGYAAMPTYFKREFESEDYRTKQINNGVRNIAVHFLARSIEAMSRVDAIYFCQGWQKARGCRIEQQIAEKYDIETMYE